MDELFQRFLSKHAAASAVRTIGVGIATQITDASCTVVRDGQPDLLDVRFHATEDKTGSHHVTIPADGSSVLYGIIDNQQVDACIIMCSEVQRVITTIGTAKHEIDKDGHLIGVGSDKLSKVLSDVIDEIAKIIVINGRGPNVPALKLLKEKVNKILK